MAETQNKGTHSNETHINENGNDRLIDSPSEWLSDWFISRRKFKGDPASLLSINYFEAGLLTSLEVIEFVSEIEDRFGATFSDHDFQDPRFVTVAGLAELISELQAKSIKKE